MIINGVDKEYSDLTDSDIDYLVDKKQIKEINLQRGHRTLKLVVFEGME